MSGTYHFREAGRLLDLALGDIPSDESRAVVLAAQVHATLALAAVTAAAELSLTSLGKDRPIEAWREVIL